MKTRPGLALILIMIVTLFTACPYSSPVPIDKPNVKVDKKLLGRWYIDESTMSTLPKIYEFKKESEFTYKILVYDSESDIEEGTPTLFTGHFTQIEDYTFLNMKPDEPDMFIEDAYYIVRLDIAENKKEFILYEVTENIDEKFEKQEEFYEFVKTNMRLSFFYDNDDVKYTRNKPEKED